MSAHLSNAARKTRARTAPPPCGSRIVLHFFPVSVSTLLMIDRSQSR